MIEDCPHVPLHSQLQPLRYYWSRHIYQAPPARQVYAALKYLTRTKYCESRLVASQILCLIRTCDRCNNVYEPWWHTTEGQICAPIHIRSERSHCAGSVFGGTFASGAGGRRHRALRQAHQTPQFSSQVVWRTAEIPSSNARWQSRRSPDL